MSISIVILTYNSEATIGGTLASVARVSDDIHIVDSFSSDRTLEVAKSAGAIIIQRAFSTYSDQRNWAITNLPLRYKWQLHLDADEILSDELIAEIRKLDGHWPEGVDGFFIPRLIRFLGQDLRHGAYYPIYHMRLFRSGSAKVEDRRYDQHFILNGRGNILSAPFIDDHRITLNEWIQRHNRWSDLEVDDLLQPFTGSAITPDDHGNPLERARARKSYYYKFPLFWRALLLFTYRYFLRGGFMDGTPGLIYCVLQSFWFRFLVDAKLYERRKSDSARSSNIYVSVPKK